MELPNIDLESLLEEIEADKKETVAHEVIVTCKSAKEQRGLMSHLSKKGFKCRARSA